ncbi:MAG: GAF domain-containing sensor histidine kinase [Pirellulales bacterium]|nr:GAF domain-containing sensor histidine kinase [Pirellulales bacterium]
MGKRRSHGTPPGPLPHTRSKVLGAITPDAEFDLLRRLASFTAQLRDARDAEKILTSAVKLGLDFFAASEACIGVLRPGRSDVEVQLSTPPESPWDAELLGGFLRGQKLPVPSELMLARIRRYGRMWAVLAVRDPSANFRWDARQALSSIGNAATQLIERGDAERIRQVRARIDEKSLNQIGSKDLFYQTLHGLRSLIGYDHSAALFTCDDERTTLELVGEQIAWRKAKSQKIGLKLKLAPPVLNLLKGEVVYGFDREGRHWSDWTDSGASALAELLDYNWDGLMLPSSTAESAMLCAPLVTRHGVLGVLKVAAVHPRTFGPYEVEILSQFLPQVAVALENIRRTETLEMRVRAAERKQAMADLARGVSHDVNNALGAVLPLVQQLRDDLATGAFDPRVATEDLEQIERSLQICRRIFGGMLGFARSGARNPSEVYLAHEIDAILGVFREGLQRRGIEIAVDVPKGLPPLVAIQADIEQLLLNLVSNARDAMQRGGLLNVRADKQDGRIELVVADTGCGIAPADLPKIQEPFFTTKPTGNGLGLSICRSILSQMRGRMHIESKVDQGTTVRVTFPLPEEPVA